MSLVYLEKMKAKILKRNNNETVTIQYYRRTEIHAPRS